jgi:Leucine-rich repeat (LRR) protein
MRLPTSMTTLPHRLLAPTRRRFSVLLAATAVAFCLGQPHLRAVTATDLTLLENTLNRVATKGAAAFEGNLAAGLESQWKLLSDPGLQAKARELTLELEKAAAWRLRLLDVIAKTNEAKGTLTFDNGGPDWLREHVHDDAMHVFDRLTGISLYDGGNPHDKAYKRNESLNDDWLANVADLPDLTSLDLANTSVKGPGLKVVATLKNLESLNLTLTPVTDQYLEPLQTLTKLKVLGLASAQCTGEGYRFFDNLKQLENANFHFTPVNDAGLAGISHVPSLIRLEIVHTHFTDAGTSALAKLVNMERLQIGSREATGAAVAPLVAMKKLRELDLHDGQATVEGLKHASHIPTLTVLRVYGPVKDEGATEIAKLKNLQTLIIPNSGITDAGLEQLAALKELKSLDIKGCKVTDAGVAKLKQAIPALEVVQ